MIRLPKWFVFQKVTKEVSPEELIITGKKRIDFLLFASEKNLEEPDENHIIGHMALRITAAFSDNALFLSWFIEREGDVFSMYFKKASPDEREVVIRSLFPDILIGWQEIASELMLDRNLIWQELSHILSQKIALRTQQHSLRRGELRKLFEECYERGNLIAVKFWLSPTSLFSMDGILLRGWLILPYSKIYQIAKSRFQRLLKEKIDEIKYKKVPDEKSTILKQIANALAEYWKEKRAKKILPKPMEKFAGKPWQREDLFPPCMRILLEKLRATGYLTHGERLQLGLFLKWLGMPLEEQLKFWYSFAVDNVGMTWEEFEKKGGYYIKHIYGLVGSRKNYQAPKCETIINRYFCPLKHMKVDEVMGILKTFVPMTREQESYLRDLIRRGDAQKACSFILSLLTGKKILKPVVHPLWFFRIMYKHEKELKKREKSA